MENKMEKIKCPICHQKDALPYASKNRYDFYRSNFCGLIFVEPLPEDTSGIYGKDYFQGAKSGFGYADYDSDKESMIPVFSGYLKEISKYTSSQRRLLDVGAASGSFLDAAKNKGWDVMGVEVSEYASNKAREKGLNVVTGTIHTDALTGKEFQVITMLDVIEHLPEPKKDLREICSLLEDRGTLIINTPDSASLWARIWGAKWHQLIPPEHLHLFNGKALKIILKDSGFDILDSKKIGKSFSVPYILSIMSGWLGINALRSFGKLFDNKLLRKISIPINLRDNIFIIARKNNKN